MVPQTDTITFRYKAILKFKWKLIHYPPLDSPKQWIQKGLKLLKRFTPSILNYLARQKVMAHLPEYKIILLDPEVDSSRDADDLMTRFNIWLQKEKAKRLTYVIIEAILLPVTPILAILPGPNVFFYIPALLFYYHFRSLRGLKRVKVEDLNMEVKWGEKMELKKEERVIGEGSTK